MARIYTSRQLIDPGMYGFLNRNAQNKLDFETAQNKLKYDAIRKLLTTGAGVAGGLVEKGLRKDAVDGGSEWELSPAVVSDPGYKAAKEEYIRTGSSGPLQQFIMQKEAAEARKEEAKRRAEQEAADEKWHNAVRLAQARPEYGKVQKAMFDAIDAGDYETADIMKKQLQAYETEFGSEAFGSSAESMAEARKKTAEETAAKKAQEKLFNDSSYTQRMWVETNIIPYLKNIQDKTAAHEQVERMSPTLSDDDRRILHDKIDTFQTVSEAKQKAVQGAQASAAGEEVTQKIKTSKETMKKAEEAKKALEQGYKLTADEQDAYNAVYGGK